MILIDGNSIGFAASAGKSMSAGDLPTQGIFGTMTRLAEIRRNYRGKMIVLWDARSWRYDVYPAYKGNRKAQLVELVEVDSSDPTAVPTLAPISKSLQAQLDLKAQWDMQRPYVCRLLRSIGVAQMNAKNMEADDLAARLVRLDPVGEHLLVTGDADWKQLVAPNVTWYCPIQYQVLPGSKPRINKITTNNFEEATGCKTPWDFVQTKALIGDMGDNIPGVGGIGPVNAKYILEHYGSVDALFNEALTGCSASWPKRVREFADDDKKRAYYEFNLLMVWLNHPKAPPTKNPVVVKGPQLPDLFVDTCGELAFSSFIDKHERFLDIFNPDHKDNQ